MISIHRQADLSYAPQAPAERRSANISVSNKTTSFLSLLLPSLSHTVSVSQSVNRVRSRVCETPLGRYSDGIAIEKSRERSDRSEKRERKEVKFFGNLTFEKSTFEKSM